jgi:copper chaperone CopZ
MITLFALLMLSFPYYAHAFYPKQTKEFTIAGNAHIKRAEFKISGMTCASCEQLVIHEVTKLEGVVNIRASYALGNAIVEFDERRTIKDIENAINKTGYKVTKVKQ